MDKLGAFLKGDNEPNDSQPEREKSGDEIFDLEKLLIREPTLKRFGSSSRSINSTQSSEMAAKRRTAKIKKYGRRSSDVSSIHEADFKTLVDFSKMAPLDSRDFTPTEQFKTGVLDYDSALFYKPKGPTKDDLKRQKIIEHEKKRKEAMRASKIIGPMVIQLKPYQIDELKEAFNLLDNGQEMMDVRDAISILRACGVEPDHEQTKEIFKEIKPGNEDFINSEELIKLFSVKLQKQDPIDEIRRAFKLFDTDNKGYVTLDNLRDISQLVGENLHEEELKEMIEGIDAKDKNGVTIESFVNFMKKKEWFD